MKAADVQEAVLASDFHPITICAAIGHLLPIIERLREGRPWYVRYGIDKLLRALQDYRAERCG